MDNSQATLSVDSLEDFLDETFDPQIFYKALDNALDQLDQLDQLEAA